MVYKRRPHSFNIYNICSTCRRVSIQFISSRGWTDPRGFKEAITDSVGEMAFGVMGYRFSKRAWKAEQYVAGTRIDDQYACVDCLKYTYILDQVLFLT